MYKVRNFSNTNKLSVIDVNSAREHLINAFFANANRRKIVNSVGLGLLGAGAGNLAGLYTAGKSGNRKVSGGVGLLIGGLTGAVAGYKSPNLFVTDEKARANAIGTLKELGWSYTVTVDPITGEVKDEAFQSDAEAINHAKEMKLQGKKSYVILNSSFDNID